MPVCVCCCIYRIYCCSACNAVDVLDPHPNAIFLIRDLFRTMDSGEIGSCAELRNLVGISSGQQDAEEFETVLLARIQNELAELATTEVRSSVACIAVNHALLLCCPFTVKAFVLGIVLLLLWLSAPL
jgi:hypothetical protein